MPCCRASFDDVAAGHGFDEAVHGGLNFVEIGLRRADKDGLGDFVVFGLAEQIHRHPVGGRGAVGDDEDFRRPRTMSIPTTPNTRRLAAATKALPGPVILSTCGTDSVP